MKINETSNNSFQNKVLIDTFIEQISALQTDVGNLQIADDNLAQALATKANTAAINTAVNTGTLTSTNGNIKTLKVQGTGSSATIENATIGTASIGTESVTQSNITNLEVMDVDAGTVRTGTLTVENDATISGNVAVQDVSAKDITSASVNTLNITTAEADINKLEARNAEITGKLEVNDLEVSGAFTGVSHLETEEIDTDTVSAHTINITKDENLQPGTLNVEQIRNWVSQVMSQDNVLNPPTPALGNIDTYTIELPRFDGVFLLSWEDTNVVWSATVIGNGKSYGISWGSRTEENHITDLFQYNGKLYIRIDCNGKLKYAYSTTKELDQIVIYRNMVGWQPEKSLEELCDENSHIINAYPAGMAWFGPVFIPKLIQGEGSGGGINFKGSCTFNELPSFVDTVEGDVWNITNEAYTDNRFVEGAGKPINADDDVVVVKVDYGDGKIEEIDDPIFSNSELHILCKTINDKFIVSVYTHSETPEISSYIGVPGHWRKIEYGTEYSWADAAICLPNGRLVIGSGYGLYYSDDEGVTWTESDFGQPDDTLNAQFTYDVEHNKLFYQDNHEDGYSYDGGEHWTWYDDGDAPGYLSYIKGQLVDYPRGESSGDIYGSTDGAETFTKIGETPDWGEGQGVVSTANGTLLFLAREIEPESQYYRYKYAIFKSTDLGATWERTWISDTYEYVGYSIIPVMDSDIIIIVKINRGNPNTYNAYTSIDFGASFEEFANMDIDSAAKFSETEFLVTDNFISQSTVYSNLYLIDNRRGTHLRWDKFAAGVNYDNFVAKNITATGKITAAEAIKSSGTLEVRGASELLNGITAAGPLLANLDSIYITNTGTAYEAYSDEKTVHLNKGEILFGDVNQIGDHDISGTLRVNTIKSRTSANPVQVNDDLDITGSTTLKDIIQTGNLTQTGNETIIGTVVIGDLD